MYNREVGIWIRAGIRLCKLGPLSKHVCHQFLCKCSISGFWEKRLLLKDCKECHWFFKHVNALLKIHSEVNISPVKTFLYVFLLLKGEHVLVEKLLKLLINIVDADLLKPVIVKNFKSCNIQHSNILYLLHCGINEGFVTFINNNSEGSFVDGTSNTSNRVSSLGASRSFVNPFSSYL